MITRRQFMATVVIAASGVELGRAADVYGSPRRIGFFWDSSKKVSEESGAARAFESGMKALGYTAGRNYVLETRYADGLYEGLDAMASELLKQQVELVVTTGAAATAAMQRATTSIPIIFAVVNDASGFAKTLSHPGGNLTGLSRSTADISPKHIELLRSVRPGLKRIAVVLNPGNPSHPSVRKSIEAAARKAGIESAVIDARSMADIEKGFSEEASRKTGAVIVALDQGLLGLRKEIAASALKHRLATIYAVPDDVEVGGLMCYGPSYTEFFRLAAGYVDRVLRGAKPGDLPIEMPTRFEMVINRRTANALGLKIPNELLLRADRVIGE